MLLSTAPTGFDRLNEPCKLPCRPGGEIGRRTGLKILCPVKGRAGSSPAPAILLARTYADFLGLQFEFQKMPSPRKALDYRFGKHAGNVLRRKMFPAGQFELAEPRQPHEELA